MKERLSKAIEYIIKSLIVLKSKLHKKEEIVTNYSSLSPIDNGKDENSYSRALLWALLSRKKNDIKNIALTGPYGSGKSTILKTLQKNYHGTDLFFLNISLATFKEEVSAEKENSKKDKSDLLKQIEISILEQIFYHEHDSKVPDSRFKKIRSYKRSELFFYSAGYLIIFLAACNFIYPNFLKSIFKEAIFSKTAIEVLHYCTVTALLIGIASLIYNSIRIINSLAFNKLNIQNIEIGLGDNLNKSVLNQHVDEIIYFFTVRPYNVVIIEDLDRFQETEIFTKLREINLLLNNSEKTKRKEIVFIYAIRDEMFTDKDRTKFFDFIIPVIPIINSSNSSEILLKRNFDNKYNISNSVIEGLAFFIDDMRLLNNITNEFTLYNENLEGNLSKDKLFAMIVYKNICPKDFVNLTYNRGIVYDIMQSKKKFIDSKVNELNKQINLIIDT